MSWMFKRDSPLRSSLRRKYSFTLPPKLPEGACLEVFRTHWNQAYAIIEKNGYVFFLNSNKSMQLSAKVP